MIDKSHALSVARQAELLNISRSNVYYLPQAVPEADLALMRRMDECISTIRSPAPACSVPCCASMVWWKVANTSLR